MKEKIIAFTIFFFGFYSQILGKILDIVSIDEIVSMVLIIPIIFNIHSALIEKKLLKIVILLACSILVGVFSSFYFQYQDLDISFFGAIVYFKSLIPFFFIISFAKSRLLDFNIFLKSIKINLYFSIIILTLGNIIQYLSGDFGVWHGIPQFFSFIEPPAVYGLIMSFLCLILFYLNIYKKQPLVLFIIIFISLIISLRVKAIGFGLLLLYFYFSKRQLISYKSILVAGIGIIFLITNNVLFELIFLKLNNTFLNNSELWNTPARFALHLQSFIIAIDHFPLGSGFATFGSHFSRISYSPLYSEYGLNEIWGLSRENPAFVTDTQISPIIAELGFIGAILYFLCLIRVFSFSFGKWKFLTTNLKIMYLLCIGFLLINITSSQILFSSFSAGFYSLLASIYLFEYYEKYKGEKSRVFI